MGVRGLHIYGGALICCIGLGLWYYPLGIATGGAVLLWLGLFWVKAPPTE